MNGHIKYIKPDGNCFFNAIIYAVKNCPFDNIYDFRFEVYNYMLIHAKKYMIHYTGDYLKSIEQITIDCQWNCDIFDIVPNAVSDMLMLCIEIHERDGFVVIIGDEYRDRIKLLYNKEGMHYDVIENDGGKYLGEDEESYEESEKDDENKYNDIEKELEECITPTDKELEEIYQKEFNEYEFYKNLKLF